MDRAHLDPPRSMPTCTARAPHVRWPTEDAARAYEDLGRYRVLDVGCGIEPYESLFAPFADAYVGVDPVENPRAELQGALEDLPVEDGSYGAWASVRVTPGSGTTACVGMLVSINLDLFFRRAHAGWIARSSVTAINRVAEAVDSRSARLRDLPRGTLLANFHIVGEVPK